MSRNSGAYAADGMAKDGFARKLPGSQAVHHGHVSAEITAPAHAHGGEYSYVRPAGLTCFDHFGDQSDGRSRGTQGSDRYGDAFV